MKKIISFFSLSVIAFVCYSCRTSEMVEIEKEMTIEKSFNRSNIVQRDSISSSCVNPTPDIEQKDPPVKDRQDW